MSKETDEQKQVAASAEEAKAEESLEAKVGESLAGAFAEESESTPGDKPAEEEEESKKSTPEDKPADEEDDTDDSTPERDDEEPADKEELDDKEEEDDEPADKGKKSTPVESAIPDPYRRAAIHSNWSEEEIRALEEKDPKLALKTCKKLYDNIKKTSDVFSGIGRKAMKNPSAPANKSGEEAGEDTPIDLEKFKEDFRDEPAIVAVVEQLVKRNAKLEKAVKTSATEEGVVDGTDEEEDENLRVQVNSFFAGDDMKVYHEHYGKVSKGESGWDELTGIQKNNRLDVITLADQICRGAIVMGNKITVEEAMNMAHLSQSKPVLEKAIKEDIKKTVKKRTKTLAPGNTAPVPASKELSGEALEVKIGKSLAKCFGTKV